MLSKAIRDVYRQSKSREYLTSQATKSYQKRHKHGKRKYSTEKGDVEEEITKKSRLAFLKNRKLRYGIGGGILLLTVVGSEVFEMRSIDEAEKGVSAINIKNDKELSEYLLPLSHLMSDYTLPLRLKNITRMCDFLMKVTLDDETSPQNKAIALMCLRYLAQYSDIAVNIIYQKLDFYKMQTVYSEMYASSQELDIFYNNRKERKENYPTLEKRIIFRNSYNLLLCALVKNPETHNKLIQNGILNHIKILINDSNGEYIYGVHMLKYLSMSDRGGREILKEDFVPKVYDKIVPNPSSKIPEWNNQGSYSSEFNYLKVHDFLRNMETKFPNEMKAKYPNIHSSIENMLSRVGRTYESSRSAMNIFNSIKYVLTATVAGITYGGIRQFIFNRRNPELARSILKYGSFRAAAAAGVATLATEMYINYRKEIFSDERLFVFNKIVLTLTTVGYFYFAGTVAPYSFVPYVVGRWGSRADEFDVHSIREGIQYRKTKDEVLRKHLGEETTSE